MEHDPARIGAIDIKMIEADELHLDANNVQWQQGEDKIGSMFQLWSRSTLIDRLLWCRLLRTFSR